MPTKDLTLHRNTHAVLNPQLSGIASPVYINIFETVQQHADSTHVLMKYVSKVITFDEI